MNRPDRKLKKVLRRKSRLRTRVDALCPKCKKPVLNSGWSFHECGK